MHPDINNTISMSDPRVLRSHAQVKAHKLTTQPQHSKDEGHGHRVRGGARTRFLSLPPEIRNEIYKLITETDLILFYDKFWYPKAPARPSSRIANTTWPACFDSASIPQTHGLHECTSQYQYERNRKKSAGALSWLRTNRQIHDEARSIVYHNLNIHVSEQVALAGLLFPSDTTFKFAAIRSLSVCLLMPIVDDGQDGFRFAREGQYRGWRIEHHGDRCPCVLCNTFGKGDIIDILPGLRTLELSISFVCVGGNTRPVVGYFANGNPRYGMLNRPKNPSPLVYKGNIDNVEEIMRCFRRQQPMACFHGRMGKDISLDIRIRLEKVHHDPGNVFPNPNDRKCWCKGRNIDEESLGNSGLQSRLMEKLEEGGFDAWNSFKRLRSVWAP
tara:strand:+ start:3139 stop:4296 length:1158 start_codon:yes stop_codon:yes gene_type:complete